MSSLYLSIYLFVYVKQFYQYSLAMYDQQQHPPTQFAKIIIIVVRLNWTYPQRHTSTTTTNAAGLQISSMQLKRSETVSLINTELERDRYEGLLRS